MNERKLADGWHKGMIPVKDVGTWTDKSLLVFYHEGAEEFYPRRIAPDSCFEPVEPEPSIEEKLAEKGGAIAAEIERRLQEGATVFLRVFTNADHPRAGEVGRARSVGADSEDGPWVRCLWNNACTSRIRPDEGAILSDSEVLALLNREASDG